MLDLQFGLKKVLIGRFILSVPKLKHIVNQLHFDLVHVTAKSGMGISYATKQMDTGHYSIGAAIKLIRKQYSQFEVFRSNSIRTAKRWVLSETPGLEQDAVA